MPQGTDGLLCLCIGRVRQNLHTPLIPPRVLRLVPRRFISGAGFRAVEEQDFLLVVRMCIRYVLACNAQIYHLWGGRPTVLRLLRGVS